MGLTCNIDAAGKRARLQGGIAAVLLAIVVAGVAYASDIAWLWMVDAVLILGGGLMIFEARAGWCAMRAMGFKTKI